MSLPVGTIVSRFNGAPDELPFDSQHQLGDTHQSRLLRDFAELRRSAAQSGALLAG
jgi:hypothetical protein